MAFNPIAPVTGDPVKKKQNTAVKNADGTVTLNDSVNLTKEGQSTLLRKKYEHQKDAPYLGKYGATYADEEGFETKGGNVAGYKEGFVSFNNRYNQDDQQMYMDKIRGLPENKGRGIYLKGSNNPKYMAPKGYSATVTETVDPLAPIK